MQGREATAGGLNRCDWALSTLTAIDLGRCWSGGTRSTDARRSSGFPVPRARRASARSLHGLSSFLPLCDGVDHVNDASGLARISRLAWPRAGRLAACLP